jgi:diguanylate cyclase (GGDEF)-like protein
VKRSRPAPLPHSRHELQSWLHKHLDVAPDLGAVVIAAIDSVLTRHKQLVEASKEEEIQALSAGFAYKIARLQRELSEKGTAATSISHYLGQLLADLTAGSHRDPKTTLMSVARFTNQFESFLSFEQRSRWCAIGMADIARLESYDATRGRALSDLIVRRVAQLLRDQARAGDLHSRFKGNAFCFLIPGLHGPEKVHAIGERFRRAVERDNWTLEDRHLAEQPIRIDVGVAGFRLGQIAERRFIARRLASDLLARADGLMRLAKQDPVSHIRLECVRIRNGELVPMAGRS